MNYVGFRRRGFNATTRPDTKTPPLADKDSEKPFLYASFSKIGGYPNIFSRQTVDPLWKAARKGSAPAFASFEVSRMNKVCREHLQQWIADIPDEGLVFDPSEAMIRLTFFIVMESAFEYAPTEEEYKSFVANLELALREFVFRQSVNPLRQMFGFLIPEARRAVQASRQCQVLGQRVLDAYRSNPDKSTHNTLIKLIDENPAFAGNDPWKVSELVTYLTAGFDTTGYTLSSTLVLLAQHPEVVQKARDSMMMIGTAAAKEGTTMMTDPIHHILAESNRLYPVAAMGSSRFVPRDITVFDQKSQRHYVIPKGSNCLMPQYLANRNPAIFGDDADEFRPDRWIDASPTMTDAKLMFALGNRNCIGQSLALAELHSVLPRLIQHYNMELLEPGHLDYFLTLKFHGAQIKLTKVQ
jgi:cytochrome P450 / NADPH-cytochrome P450 reductase